jgi:monoamine oxidase
VRESDVVVIGAGISGLAVAEAVHRGGRTVTVLEARHRIGGRLLSDPLDLVASWFWDGERRVRAMTDRFGISTFPQHIAGDAMIDERDGVHRYPGNPIDAPAYRFTRGADSLTDALAGELPEGTVLLNHPVTSISDDLLVTTAEGSWQPQHVVIAVPPSVAATTIRLPESLPSNVLEIAQRTPVWMGDTIKVVAMYDEPFWRTNGLAGAAISRVGPLHELHDLSGLDGTPAALFGFARGGQPLGLSEADVRVQLARIFGSRAGDPRKLQIEDWSREQWTNPGAAASAEGFLRSAPDYSLFGNAVYQQAQLGGRLHWSTTETARNYAGHIEGALEAAERTVNSIASMS